MSDLEEPRIRCPGCGKLAPAMKYCIYCGAKMPQAAPPIVTPPTSGPSIPPPVPPTTAPPTAPTAAKTGPPPFPTAVRDEIANLMSGITTFYKRKVSLLELFQSGQVSERVFLNLYNEYASKLKDSVNARASKMEELKSKLNERNKRLSEVGMKLEELEVRRKVGEIDAKDYGQKADNLKAEERELVDSVKTLKMNIETLENMFTGEKPSEIRDLEINVRSYQSVVEKLVNEGKISAETFKAVKPDIEETLDFFDFLIKDRKEREKNLRENLETLQTRYKLSELSIDEYEKRKRELQAEIDKIWA